MLDFYVVPFISQVLSHEAAMAMMWPVFAAKQAGTIKLSFVNSFNFSLRHQIEKFLGVQVPRTLLLLVLIEHVLRRRERWHVLVLHTAQLMHEVLQVITFGEARKLRHVVEAHIYQFSCARTLQTVKEMLRSCLSEANRENFHLPVLLSAK